MKTKFNISGNSHFLPPLRGVAGHLRWACLLALLLLLAAVRAARAQTATPEAPPGFQLVSSGEGVWLFRRDYPNGTPDFVQVVDLSKRASLRLLYANIIQPRPGRGVYGGDDPRFSLQPLDMFWEEAMLLDERTFCVSNGSFFYMPETPTRLAFPLKVDGKRITDGFGILTYPEQKLMLELWDDHADIRELSYENLNYSSASDIIGGLKEDANKRARFAVARTFVGLADHDRDRRYETILILNTSTAVQAEVAQTLREFGAEKVMMLDGGGSTQLMCQGNSIISSERLVPQAIAVVEGGAPAISGSTFGGPLWLVAESGQDVEIDLSITNDGSETWQPGEHLFVYEEADGRTSGSISFSHAVAAGEAVDLRVKVSGFQHGGLHQLKLFWYIESGGRRYAGNPLDLRIAVLSPQAEVQAEITAGWATETPPAVPPGSLLKATAHVIDAPALELIDTQGPRDAQPVDSRNLLWVPLLMLPFALLLLVVLVRNRGSGL